MSSLHCRFCQKSERQRVQKCVSAAECDGIGTCQLSMHTRCSIHMKYCTIPDCSSDFFEFFTVSELFHTQHMHASQPTSQKITNSIVGVSQLTVKIPIHTNTDIFMISVRRYRYYFVKKCRSVFIDFGIFGICRYTTLL